MRERIPKQYCAGGFAALVQLSHSLRKFLVDEADPSVRYRSLRELLDRPPDDPEVVRARKQIGRQGWAARILLEQMPDGHWDTPGTSPHELYRPKYIATNWRLLLLADLGVRGDLPRVKRAVELFLRRYSGNANHLGGPGSEVCFTGNAVRMLCQFGQANSPRVRDAVDWLVRHQKHDGGWHCFPSRHGTLDGWEALSAFAALPKPLRSAAVERSIERGAEFYLARGLLREGRSPYAPWLRLHFPVHYYYDLLVGLDTLTRLGYGDDPRMRPAISRLLAKRNRDGTWNLDALHPDSEDPSYRPNTPVYPLAVELPGRPSQWITLTALTVLRHAGR
jgi:squalene-hopene cyclase-like protein